MGRGGGEWLGDLGGRGMNGELLVLPRNCANCAHFDGEHWCRLAEKERIVGFIWAAPLVVCAKHKPQEPEIEGAAV